MDKRNKPMKNLERFAKGENDYSLEINGINYPVHKEVLRLFEALHRDKENFRSTLISLNAVINSTLDEIK